MTTNNRKEGKRKEMQMKEKLVLACVGALLACGLFGCGNASVLEKNEATNISSDQPIPEMTTGWIDVAESYAAFDADAQAKAAGISGDGATVRKQVYDIIDEIIANIPAAIEAVESGNIDSATETALQTIYIDGKALESLGDQDTTDVGIYISDLGHDAQWLVANVYNGDVANADLAQSEVDENYDKVKSFDEKELHDKTPEQNETQEEHWNEFAQRIS